MVILPVEVLRQAGSTTRTYPPNATRRPSVLMMVCAVRLGTLTDGHAKNALHRTSWCRASLRMTTHHRHTHTHTSIHTYNRNTHTRTYTTTHAHTNYSHSHISLRHNSHHTYIHDHTGIIHTYTNTYMHSHTRIPPPTQSPIRFFLSVHSCTFTFLSLSFGRS